MQSRPHSDSSRARLHYARADLRLSLGDTSGAIDDFRRVLELDRDEVLDATERLGRLGVMVGDNVSVLAYLPNDDPDERAAEQPASCDDPGNTQTDGLGDTESETSH